MTAPVESPPKIPPFAGQSARRWQWRRLKDLLTRYGMGVGGISVIIAILLIFFYLLYVVFPLFVPAGMQVEASYPAPRPEAGRTVHLAIEEQNELAVRFTELGRAIFFRTHDGQVVLDEALPLPAGSKVTSFAQGSPARGIVVFGLSNGSALVARHVYHVTYPGDQRLITPAIEYPVGPQPLKIAGKGQALTRIAVRNDDEVSTMAALTADGQVRVSTLQRRETMDDEVIVEQVTTTLTPLAGVQDLAIAGDQRLLYVIEQSGDVNVVDLGDKEEPRILERKRLAPKNTQITSLRFLIGGISLLVGSSDGRITQWFPVRDDNNQTSLTRIREFNAQRGAITAIVTEQQRKGFMAVDDQGMAGVYHTTAHRTLLAEKVSDAPLVQAGISPRADAAVMEDSAGRLHVWRIHNEHPEISWSSLWGKVWYESYGEPDYVWQSSSASNDFEPKMSLTPLAFGTFKAALYAMLIAAPLAIMGAIYTAYFMAPRMRSVVKPTIEIMEALPTVILGFLAGLWLAPLVESNLPGIFALLLILPPGILVFAYAWRRLPVQLRGWVPDGWQAALLVPVILAIAWLAFSMGHVLEQWWFGGSMQHWMSEVLGISFDQRNALVVGLAMGVAVIPTIFSIAEDAIFSVPKHLTFGSLAMGATPWQTLVRVVLLTASPGIFSAVMIGLGRAVGETMIVLMATGNTPVMDFNLFQGMRTLSANIAVEMPESEVSSTHYRVLFLAALILFMFTFVFNTVAEIVRQRLRGKYSSL